MRRIGLLGGMSWHSSIEYYTKINNAVAERLGGHHSAQILLDSTDFANIRAMQVAENWAGSDASLVSTAQRLVNGGAEVVAIATNLMHECAPAIEESVDAPLIHIVDSIVTMAKRQGYSTLAVVGTKWTMLVDFYTGRLEAQGGSHARSRRRHVPRGRPDHLRRAHTGKILRYLTRPLRRDHERSQGSRARSRGPVMHGDRPAGSARGRSPTRHRLRRCACGSDRRVDDGGGAHLRCGVTDRIKRSRSINH